MAWKNTSRRSLLRNATSVGIGSGFMGYTAQALQPEDVEERLSEREIEELEGKERVGAFLDAYRDEEFRSVFDEMRERWSPDFQSLSCLRVTTEDGLTYRGLVLPFGTEENGREEQPLIQWNDHPGEESPKPSGLVFKQTETGKGDERGTVSAQDSTTPRWESEVLTSDGNTVSSKTTRVGRDSNKEPVDSRRAASASCESGCYAKYPTGCGIDWWCVMKTAISLIGVFGACTACFGTAGLACGLCLVACLGYAATIYSCMERLEYVPGEGPVDYAYQECDTEIEWIPESEWDEYWDEGEDDKYCDDYDCI